MHESSTYRAIFREGEQRGHDLGIAEGLNLGIAEGLTKGRDQGVDVGRLEGLRLSLVMLLEQKFGRVPAELDTRIQTTTDSARLQAAVRQLLTIQAIDDLIL